MPVTWKIGNSQLDDNRKLLGFVPEVGLILRRKLPNSQCNVMYMVLMSRKLWFCVFRYTCQFTYVGWFLKLIFMSSSSPFLLQSHNELWSAIVLNNRLTVLVAINTTAPPVRKQRASVLKKQRINDVTTPNKMSDHNQGLGVGLICKGVCVRILFGDKNTVKWNAENKFVNVYRL